MGKRSTGRKLAMQALYQTEIRKCKMQNILPEFITDSNYAEPTKEWASDLAQKAWDKKQEADSIIKQYSIGWDLSRMTPIDKNILRLALYELIHTDTPPSVVLNEAIEISKKYSTDDSPKFINGILGNYVKKEMKKEK